MDDKQQRRARNVPIREVFQSFIFLTMPPYRWSSLSSEASSSESIDVQIQDGVDVKGDFEWVGRPRHVLVQVQVAVVLLLTSSPLQLVTSEQTQTC